MKKSIVVPVLLALAIALAACAPAATPAPTQPPAPTKAQATEAPKATEAPQATEALAMKDIVDTAVAAGSFKTLATALQAAGLVDALKGKGPFTVFAPTDEAFAKLPKETLAALLKDPQALGEILKYHVVSGTVKAVDVVKLSEAKTLQGEPITIKVDGNTVMINDAKVVKTDIETSNGVIHVIDTVIMPPSMVMSEKKDIVDTAVAAGSFKTLAAALQATGLVDALKGKGPFTVFAPTDEAFAKLPAGTLDSLLKNPDQLKKILLYHVVEGNVIAADAAKLTSAKTLAGDPISINVSNGSVRINNSKVITADIVTSNGVIHAIDAVLLPPAADAMSEAPAKDIVDTAVTAGNFKTLAAALQAAGLVDALKGKGPFTVFAPTDEAFAALPKGTLEALLKDPKKLADILKYHVMAGQVLAADAAKLTEAKTLEGAPIKISVKDGKVFINDAEVITADILTSNGVIHVINKVILPPQ